MTAAVLAPLLSILPVPETAVADDVSAKAAMEDPANPLLLIETGAGPIYVELLLGEAPLNTAHFLALAQPGAPVSPAAPVGPRGLFDGLRFDRVVPGFLIQAGIPDRLGEDRETVAPGDEINADALGLDREPVLYENGEFNPLLNIQDKSALEETLLRPLYRRLGIEGNAEVTARQDEILSELAGMSVKDTYMRLGYRYQNSTPSRGFIRGVVAFARRGLDDSGSVFFILLRDALHLNGRHTVIGRVVEGLETADRIAAGPADGLEFPLNGRLIRSIRQIE